VELALPAAVGVWALEGVVAAPALVADAAVVDVLLELPPQAPSVSVARTKTQMSATQERTFISLPAPHLPWPAGSVDGRRRG